MWRNAPGESPLLGVPCPAAAIPASRPIHQRKRYSAKHGLVSEVKPATSDLAASTDEFAATACATGIDREEVEARDFDARAAA